MITVEILDRSKQRVQNSLALSFTVQSYASDAIGGPTDASITVTGSEAALARLRSMLGYYVILRNSNNTPVWWGMLEEVVVSIGGISTGVSLSDMRNRVKINYTIRDGDGYAVSVTTDWVQHDRSVAIYGAREMIYTAGEMSPAGAAALAARELDKLGLPKQAVGVSSGNTATIQCVGIWSTLAWTYYANAAGREVYDVLANSEQVIGWGFTASDVGFADRAIHKLSGGLRGAVVDDAIRVTGSASNDGTFSVADNATGESTSYSSSGIVFDITDDILDDTNKGLGFVREGTFIYVTGSALNSGYHLVDGRGRNHITTDTDITPAIVAEAAGPTILIEQGETLPLDYDVATEIPGASITVTGYTKIAYSFTPTENLPAWKAAEVWVRARKVGSPSDSMRVDLCSDSSGSPGSVLDYQTITASAMLQNANWIQLSLASTADITYGTTYWIVVYRTGANSGTDYYSVGVDEDIQRSGGSLKIYNGSSWGSRPTDAAMPFQIWGATDTTTQMADILGAEGQFIEGNSIRDDSAIAKRQYRDGSTDALYELEKLLAEGTSGGDSLLVRMTPEFYAIIEAQPTNWDYAPVILRQGPELVTPGGRRVEEGVLPVGQWCIVDGVTDDVAGLAPMSPFLIGYLNYNAVRGEISSIRAVGANSIFNFARIAQG